MKKIIALALSSLIVFGIINVNMRADEIKYDNSSVIIKMTDDVQATDNLKNTLQENADVNVESIDVLNPDKENEGDVVVVELENDENITNVVEKLEKMDKVSYAQPNYIYKALGNVKAKNDCNTYGGWHLNSTNLNPQPVKNQLSTKQPVEVGVLDTGILATHTEFSGTGLDARYNSAKSYDFVYYDKTPDDGDGHGTHVSGTIAGRTMGVGSKAKIVSYRVLDENGDGYTSSIIAAINKANTDKVKILNASLGSEYNDMMLYDAIAKYDGLLIAAAGNDGSSKVNYPAAYGLDNIISVGAYNQGYTKASYSNYNSSGVDIFAPGTNILSSSTTGNNAYVCMSGTSMATPTVAGSAAMNYANNPSQSMKDLKNSIMDGANSSLSKSPIRTSLKGFSVNSGSLNLAKGFDATKSSVTNKYSYATHYATLSAGTLKLYGSNTYGQIGNGNNTTVSANSPYTVVLPDRQTVVKYYLTAKNTYIITNTNRLYVTGANDYGQLGNTSLKSTNKFVEFRKLRSTDNIKKLDFRNYLGSYDENSIIIYLREGKDAIYYKLGNYSYTIDSSSYRKSTYLQLFEQSNHRKKSVKYYNNSRVLTGQEYLTYQNYSGYLSTKNVYHYYSGFNRAIYYTYAPILKKKVVFDKYKNGRSKYYNLIENRVLSSYNPYTGVVSYRSLNSLNYTTYYNSSGIVTKKNNYKRNAYGNFKLQNKSKAYNYRYYYRNGYLYAQLTYQYNSRGSKLRSYYKKLYYSRNKTSLKKEYSYRDGRLKTNKNGRAYYYITKYKNGKSYSTYRYTYNTKGKLTNKTKVSKR